MHYNSQAIQLNNTIQQENPAVYKMLSNKGKSIFFPSLGILSQSAEAKSTKINATIGIAKENTGSPTYLESFQKNLNLKPNQIYPYAPSSGLPSIREQWKSMQIQKNPSLKQKKYSTPIVTNALTHGLSITGFLFADPADKIITPDLYWENYDLSFEIAYETQISTYPLFDAQNKFNMKGLKEQLEGSNQKQIVVFNFPNNPSGYTPIPQEIQDIANLLKESTKRGNHIIAIIDDAYFGLIFEKNVVKESIFSSLCDLHSNILAIKIDGPTKEDYAWGFRVGFVSFGTKDGSNSLYGALESKTAGAIRGSISNVSHIAQSLLVDGWKNPEYQSQKEQKFHLLQTRYRKTKDILKSHPEYQKEFKALPFNSGYFMCIKILNNDAEEIRQKLIEQSIGVIAFGNLLRIAFSSTPTDQLKELFQIVYETCQHKIL